MIQIDVRIQRQAGMARTSARQEDHSGKKENRGFHSVLIEKTYVQVKAKKAKEHPWASLAC